LRVNDNFARELDEVLKPDDLVWVHDYHLMPLAKAHASVATRIASVSFFTSRALRQRC
jgi:trehalose-6-phosphate synthase